ncbi:MAG: type II secretion system F family protein [Parcubacteria group bacterium]
MKVFYVAKNYAGKVQSGEMDVKSERDLAAQLRTDGYVLTSFKELKDNSNSEIKVKFLNRFIKISLEDKLMFTRNLSVMISSGLPLSRAIKNIAVQTQNKKFAAILNQVHEGIQAGGQFADGLAKYPGIFDDLFVNMVRVGETSGNLEEVLNILALQLEKEHELMSKVKGAMTYPAVIVVVMLVIAVLMLTYILPKLMGVFTDMNVELPATTKFIIFLSDSLRNHGLLVGIIGICAVVFMKFFLMTASGKRTVGFLAVNVPVVKKMVIKVNCSRFARIYSSLLKSGVPAVESLRIISRTLTNYYYRQAIEDSVNKIQKGIPLSGIIAEYPKIFPVLTIQMLQVGEETGKTEMVLLKLAEFYEGEVDQISKNMSSIIEPILMVFIGSAVGFFAVSMLQPMYSIMGSIK